MNRVHPLLIVLLPLLLFFFSLFELSKIKSQFIKEQESYNKSQKIATELLSYKRLYKKRERVEQEIQKIVRSKYLKDKKVELLTMKNSLKVAISSCGLRELNWFFSKILNAHYKIKSMKIKRLNKKEATAEVEITW